MLYTARFSLSHADLNDISIGCFLNESGNVCVVVLPQGNHGRAKVLDGIHLVIENLQVVMM